MHAETGDVSRSTGAVLRPSATPGDANVLVQPGYRFIVGEHQKFITEKNEKFAERYGAFLGLKLGLWEPKLRPSIRTVIRTNNSLRFLKLNDAVGEPCIVRKRSPRCLLRHPYIDFALSKTPVSLLNVRN